MTDDVEIRIIQKFLRVNGGSKDRSLCATQHPFHFHLIEKNLAKFNFPHRVKRLSAGVVLETENNLARPNWTDLKSTLHGASGKDVGLVARPLRSENLTNLVQVPVSRGRDN